MAYTSWLSGYLERNPHEAETLRTKASESPGGVAVLRHIDPRDALAEDAERGSRRQMGKVLVFRRPTRPVA